ncbi:MAG: DUF2993 domain-containing protein [Cyanobacteria bacterium P01_F01_bin.42]
MMSAVFGSLPFPGQGGDQIVSKAVSTAIAALFKRTEQISATVRAEPVAKLLQGAVDGFDFVGKGLQMYNGLRIANLEFYVDAVAIDFSAILTGQVKLKQPTKATMRVVLTQEDLTQSFNTPFVVEKLQKLQYQDSSLSFQGTQMTVNGDQSVTLTSKVQLGDQEPLDVSMQAEVEVLERRKIQFVNVQHEGSDEAIALGESLIAHVNGMLNLERFALDGMQLWVDRIRVQREQIVMYGTSEVTQFPKRR